MPEQSRDGELLKLRALIGYAEGLGYALGEAATETEDAYNHISPEEWAETVRETKAAYGPEFDWRECWVTVEIPADLFDTPTLPSKVEVPNE